MKKIDYIKINHFIVSDVIHPFYDKRLDKLKKESLSTMIRRKNPYLFRVKNVETSGDLAKAILDAFLSSQEETIFGDLMEGLAVYVCQEVFGGYKATEGKFKSVDLIFERDKKIYIVGIKSGPNWGNSDQISTMKRNFKKARAILRNESEKNEIISINGCMYGKNRNPYQEDKKDSELNYYKLCGQSFWELISGDNQLYKKIIKPLDTEVKKRDEVFKELYVQKINEMTKDIVDLFYTQSVLDWNKVVDYVSRVNNK